jgi:hypothetical protein
MAVAIPTDDGDGLYGSLVDDNLTTQYNPGQQGVFGLNPLATPKYAKNTGRRDNEFKDTLARLYISLENASPAAKQTYLASLPSDSWALANVLLANTQSGGTGFVDFFLTQANEQFQEVVQLDKVLADDYVAFFFGQEPPRFQYTGMLLNSMQDDQRGGFARAYLSILRGTQMARRGVLARLRYDSVLVSGVMMAHTQQLNSDNEMAVPFSFTFLVKEYVILNDPQFNRTTAADYVQLQADAIQASLSAASPATSNTQTNTTSVVPPVQNALSVVGAAASGFLAAAGNAMQQLVGLTNQAAAPPPVTSNVRGTVQPGGAPPIPPQATVTPAGLSLVTQAVASSTGVPGSIFP